MAKVHFRTNVLIKSILGKDLITDDNIAVLELVKNSFDANSKRVYIEFYNTRNNDDESTTNEPTSKSSRIIIRDAGIGMNETDLIDKWLNIAYSEKKEKKEEFGRLLAGNKGVGRFSCDKLGQFLNIYTRKKNGDYQHLFIDWKKFEIENQKDLDIQKIALETKTIPREKFKKKTGYSEFDHGTILEISKLREPWSEHKIISLKRQLEKLINPNQAFKKNSFHIEIIASEYKFSDLAKEEYEKVNGPVKNRIFEKLNFRSTSIESSIVDDGKHITTILQDRGNQIFKLVEKNKFRLLKDVKMVIYYLNPYSKVYFTRQAGIRSKDFGSISLFINGFRIPPYGDDGDDWLGLEIRKGQGHSRYLGTREIVGRIEVNDEENQFKIVSSRTGVVNNDPFEQLTKSTSPFGYFYKIFRRLERFVVEGIKWDSVAEEEDERKLEKRINETKNWKVSNEVYLDNESARNRRILSVINNIIDAKKDDIVELTVNKEFVVEILNEQTQNAKDELENIINQIADKNLTPTEVEELVDKLKQKSEELNAISNSISKYPNLSKKDISSFDKIQEKIENKQNELETLKQKLVEAEAIKVKLEEDLALEKEKNTFLRATSRGLSEDAKGLVHNIKHTSKNIKISVAHLVKSIKAGKFSEKDFLNKLSVIEFNNDKVYKISRIITRANFKADVNSQILDIPLYLQQYLDMYKDIFERSILNIEVKTNEIKFEKRISALDLSLIMDDLVSNAEKADAHNILVEFKKVSNNKIKILVSDDGKGVSKRFVDNPDGMFQLGISEGTEGGSGIGLHSVRSTLKQMHGEIIFSGNNKYLKGASFEITIEK